MSPKIDLFVVKDSRLDTVIDLFYQYAISDNNTKDLVLPLVCFQLCLQ